MALTFSPDVDAAGWLEASGATFPDLVTLGPAGFEAYAQLPFTADEPDLDTARRALRILKDHTTTPDDALFLVWVGYSDVLLPEGPRVHLPHREYALLRGTLEDLASWERTLGPAAWAPAFVWPADHAWCFASDVDPEWAGIGGPAAAIQALGETVSVWHRYRS